MNTHVQLQEAIKKYDRKQVMDLVKEGVLQDLSEEKKIYYIGQIMKLRDIKIMNAVFHNGKEKISPEVFTLNLQSKNNQAFVQQVFASHREQVEWNEEMVQICCKAEDVKTAGWLIRQAQSKKFAYVLAEASDNIFQLLVKHGHGSLSNDEKVAVLYHAAISNDSAERIKKLKKAGYDFKLKDASGKTAADYLQERIDTFAYGKNRNGNIMSNNDKHVYKILSNTREEMPSKTEQKDRETAKKVVIRVAIVLGILVVFGLFMNLILKNTKKSVPKTTQTTTAQATTEYDKSSSKKVKKGDTVNIDYVGYINGKAFDGGNTQGQGTQLTIGSGSYIDNFEDQLIGHKPGDKVNVKVTFPKKYNAKNLRGKKAVFKVVINGIYNY